jgi:hypothetical protein
MEIQNQALETDRKPRIEEYEQWLLSKFPDEESSLKASEANYKLNVQEALEAAKKSEFWYQLKKDIKNIDADYVIQKSKIKKRPMGID